jgi:hypothetical protein
MFGYLWLIQFRASENLAESAVHELWKRVEKERYAAVEYHYWKCRVLMSSGVCIRKFLPHCC